MKTVKMEECRNEGTFPHAVVGCDILHQVTHDERGGWTQREKTKKPRKCTLPVKPQKSRLQMPLKRLQAAFLNVVVDAGLGEARARFGALLNSHKLDDQELGNQRDNFCRTFSSGGEGDIGGKEAAVEVKNLPSLPSDGMTALERLTFIHNKHLEQLYPDLWVALRIACTLLGLWPQRRGASQSWSPSSPDVRSSMGQDRLTGLAIISINPETGEQLSCED